MKYAQIIVNISHKSVDRIFDYEIKEEMLDKIKIGMKVTVGFGRGNYTVDGFVLGFSDTTDVEEGKIKPIISLEKDYPLLTDTSITLAKWMQKKYYTVLADCLDCVLPKIANDKTFEVVSLNPGKENLEKEIEAIIAKNNKQSLVLKALYNGSLSEDNLLRIPLSHLKDSLGITTAPIKALRDKGIIRLEKHRQYRGNFNYSSVKRSSKFTPNDEQAKAIKEILKSDNTKQTVLLHGVTGSGKTEIYLQAIEEIISDGRQAIVLVPEISLTPQTVERFVSRFGNKVAVTHSRLSDGERFDQWLRARRGEIQIMIGPRSAVFTPFDNLGIIIIDEEHESSYKSELSPKYDAREVAEELARITNSFVVLGSATPSIESYFKALNKEYNLVEVKNRVNNSYPEVEVVDMRKELESGNLSMFSRALAQGIRDNLENNKQTILFLNRRGHSTFVSCRKCGEVMKCDECNVNYTYHQHNQRLVCHYCGKSIPTPSICPVCSSKYIKYFGVGTEKIEEAVKEMFPQARTIRMDMDTTKHKNSHSKLLSEFRSGGADILIGTQMIAKGLDFPDVTLVGIVAADLSLNINDYHAQENTFQLITQVAGRAGRADSLGKVYIQTYSPENFCITYAKDNDYLSFYNQEIIFRQQMNYPPFCNLFYIYFVGKSEKEIISTLYKLLDILKKYNKNNQFEQLGPSPAVISKIKNEYRWRIIIKGSDEEKTKAYALFCLDKLYKYENLSNISVNLLFNPSYAN